MARPAYLEWIPYYTLREPSVDDPAWVPPRPEPAVVDAESRKVS